MSKESLNSCNHQVGYCPGTCLFKRTKVPDAFKPLPRTKLMYSNNYEKYHKKNKGARKFKPIDLGIIIKQNP